jgi:hypothetical protein
MEQADFPQKLVAGHRSLPINARKYCYLLRFKEKNVKYTKPLCNNRKSMTAISLNNYNTFINPF